MPWVSCLMVMFNSAGNAVSDGCGSNTIKEIELVNVSQFQAPSDRAAQVIEGSIELV